MEYREYIIGKDSYHIFKNTKVWFAYHQLNHDSRAMLRIFRFRENICKENPNLIKMFFGQFDTIQTITKKNNDLENKIKDNYLYL